MTTEDIYQVEEDFRRSHAELDHAGFNVWLRELDQDLRDKLTKASAVSADVMEVTAYFLELCAMRYTIEETRAIA